MTAREKAMTPEDLTRLFVERSNAGDADGVAALYEEHAVLAYPPGSQTTGREAIRALWATVLASAPAFRARDPAAHADQRRAGPDVDTAAGRRGSAGPGRAAPAGWQLAARAGPAGVHPRIAGRVLIMVGRACD